MTENRNYKDPFIGPTPRVVETGECVSGGWGPRMTPAPSGDGPGQVTQRWPRADCSEHRRPRAEWPGVWRAHSALSLSPSQKSGGTGGDVCSSLTRGAQPALPPPCPQAFSRLCGLTQGSGSWRRSGVKAAGWGEVLWLQEEAGRGAAWGSRSSSGGKKWRGFGLPTCPSVFCEVGLVTCRE